MELEKNIKNNIENNIEIENNQIDFFNTMLGKTINGAIDIGLRSVLPDLIESQIIDIKNAIIENGMSGAIKSAVNSIHNFANSTIGIVTGRFENIDQVKIAIDNGGILDTFSNVFDCSINKIYEKGYINNTVNTILKNGKNIFLENITNNIKEEIKSQNDIIESLEKNIDNWKKSFNDNNFEEMTKIYNSIEKNYKKIIPLKNILDEIKKIEEVHNYIKDKGNNFQITAMEKELIESFSKT